MLAGVITRRVVRIRSGKNWNSDLEKILVFEFRGWAPHNNYVESIFHSNPSSDSGSLGSS